jgi:aminopeptidase N
MRKTFTFCVLFTLFFNTAIAQVRGKSQAYHDMVAAEQGRLQSAILHSNNQRSSGAGANIDVKYHRCNWRINPDSSVKSIRGSVTTYFVTKSAGVSSITFDLLNVIAVSSVTFRGSSTTFSQASNILTINLSPSLALGVLDSVTVNYAGTPPSYTSTDARVGYVRTTHGVGQNYIYTLSESFEDRDWWPCKADLTDKIDSMDIFISTPNAFVAASNGKLISTRVLGSNNTVYHWKHRYKIPSYLVCVGVANYDIVNSGTVNVGGTAVPIVHYIFPESNSAIARGALDKCKAMLDSLSDIITPYPFKDEKYGHLQFGFPGGMEHTTMSGMNLSTFNTATDWDVIAHELAHQWFGNAVTCATWNDIWLNEGMTVYTEILIAERVPGVASVSASSHRSTIKTAARAVTSLAPYLNPANTTADVFGTTSRYYNRGAMIISMLRKLVGDTKFFQALRNYINDPLLSFGAASTDDLKRHFQNVSGLNLNKFFNDWVYNTGNPTYTGNWGNSGNTISINLTQSATGASVTNFDMPVVLRIANSLGTRDTVVVIFDRNGGTLSGAGAREDIGRGITATGNVVYNLSFTPATVTFDPSNETMATGTITFLKALNIEIVNFSGKNKGLYNQLDLVLTKTEDDKIVTIEKSSNGTDFTELGTMVNSGSDAVSTRFSFNDNSPYQPNTFYRIKYSNLGGIEVYSEIVKISSGAKTQQIKISPNPASDFINLQLPQAGSNTKATIRIVNASGAVVLERSNQLIGNAPFNINISGLASGVYMVEVKGDNGFSVTEKITVNRR